MEMLVQSSMKPQCKHPFHDVIHPVSLHLSSEQFSAANSRPTHTRDIIQENILISPLITSNNNRNYV